VGIAPDQQPGGREKIAADLRDRLHKEVESAATWVNDLAAPGRTTAGGYPISFAVCDISGHGHRALTEMTDRIIQRMHKDPKISDVGAGSSRADVPQMFIDIDHEQAKQVGVAVADIHKQLQAVLGEVGTGNFNQFGRTYQIRVRIDGMRASDDAIRMLRVPNAKGEMIPLSAMATVRQDFGPMAVERLDLYPMMQINANPAKGVSLKEARALCDKIAAEEMGPGFRMTWLSDMSR